MQTISFEQVKQILSQTVGVHIPPHGYASFDSSNFIEENAVCLVNEKGFYLCFPKKFNENVRVVSYKEGHGLELVTPLGTSTVVIPLFCNKLC